MKSVKQLIIENFEYPTFLVLFILLLMTFFPLLANHPILNYDDQFLLSSLSKVSDLKNYFENILAGNILDIEPMRDFSFYIDQKIINIVPLYSYQLTNLILWFFIIYIAYKIIFHFSARKDLSLILISFYALAPTSTSSVAWISARKHILSTLFSLIAVYLSVLIFNKNKLTWLNIALVTLCYLLAILSQPINCLLPFWIFTYALIENQFNFSYFRKEKKIAIMFSALFFICLFITILNFNYYQSIYLEATRGLPKFIGNTDQQLGFTFLAIGRYFFLTLVPSNSLPVPHNIGSLENLIGLMLLPIFLFLAYHFCSKEKKPIIFLGFFYFLFPLIPVTFKLSNIFCSDTYLLNSILGILIICSVSFIRFFFLSHS